MSKVPIILRLLLVLGLALSSVFFLKEKWLLYPLLVYILAFFFSQIFLSTKFPSFSFWFSKLLDLVLVFVLLYFTGGRDSPLFFLLFLPALETALTKESEKTDFVVLLSALELGYFFFRGGLNLTYKDWLYFFAYLGALSLSSYLGLKLSSLREEISQKEAVQKALLSSLSAGLIFLDAEGKILSWNPRARQILGKLGVGQSLEALLGLEVSKDVTRGELQKGGKVLGYSLFPLYHQQRFLGWGFLFQDITETKRQERRLQEAEKQAYLGSMAAGLIHEIKNPLASISGGVQFLKEHLDSPEPLSVLELISRETDRLNRLVTNFLFFARPERGEKEWTSLPRLLREILESHRPALGGVKIRWKLPSQPLHINPEQWRQILENLLLNAVEAGRDSGRPEVEIKVEVQERYYLIQVKDNGPGIPKELQEQIFKPFFTTKPQGTGLGLAVVARIVENLKGEIQVLSKEGQGSLFQIWIPRGDTS